MPIYEITTKGVDAKRLVKADSSAQAIRHVATGQFSARLITNVSDAADMIEAGVKIEKPGEATAAAQDDGGGEPGDGAATGTGGKPPAPPSKDD